MRWPMFESAELKHTIDKKKYLRMVPKLRADLLDVQYDLLEKKAFPVLLLINGVEGAGKGETVKVLHEWMDTRHVHTLALDAPTDEERLRPLMWRFWRALPPKGTIGIMFGNWYTEPITLRADKVIRSAEFDQRLDEINFFEQMLAQEGALILKFWFHISKSQQKKRLKELTKNKDTQWRVTDHERSLHKRYDKFRAVSEHALQRTCSADAPWIIVGGQDERYRNITVGKTLLDYLRQMLAMEKQGRHSRITSAPLRERTDNVDVLRVLKLDQHLQKEEYSRLLEKWQGRLALATRRREFNDRSVILAFEGMDAAGKGGTIRRVTGALDPRQYYVVQTAAPTDEERAQPYLWRFWRYVPRKGGFAVFDRSWYGRVLVERVEDFCTESDWLRAYAEINDFEQQLVTDGAIICKFWLAIGIDEQLRRFKARERTRFKRFKITQEDWRNRKKWPLYETAVCDMVDRTSTDIAPWTLVEANNKYFARIKVLSTVCERLEAAL
jgi:AMP-polyphosphate phosphotransferase